MKFLFALAGVLLLAGCATMRTPGPARSVAAASIAAHPVLKAAVDACLPDTLFPPSNAGILVVSIDRGDTLYALNQDLLFNPASNQKMFTAAAALVSLGPDFPLVTAVSADTVSRTVVLRGHGDPLLSTEDLDSLAGLCVPALLGAPWSLLCDVSYFDNLYLGAGWTWDAEPAAYGAFVSPLILNRNTITVTAIPGLSPGDSVLVQVDPPTSAVEVENQGKTVGDSVGKRLEISRRFRERSNTVTVRGEIRAGGRPVVRSLSVWEPERYAATVFAEHLRRRGVAISEIRVDTTAPPGFPVAAVAHTVDTVTTFMNKVSDNLSAEALLKTLAAERRGRPGSAKNGIGLVNQLLAGISVDTNAVVIADGSGLSRYNLTSPSVVVGLLSRVHADTALYRAFARTLPVAGVDGTLDERMRGTAAEGNLRAKTGTLSAVSALSGYLRTRDDELIAFSIMMQNFPASSRLYRNVQDRIGAFFCEFTRRFY